MSVLDKQWWAANTDECHKTLFEYLKQLDTTQSYNQTQNLRNMRLYGNMEIGARGYAFKRVEPSSAIQNRVTLNIVQSMVDTVVSKVTKNKPKPTFLTEGGDWSLQRKAKKLTQFVEGQFQSTDFYAKSAIRFLDACIFGTGATKIFKHENDIKAERVFIDELTVDDAEAIYGEPLQLHQKKRIHRDVLMALFPDAKVAIEMLGTPDDPNTHSAGYDATTGMVDVVESWRLPSGPKAADGKHVICIETATLLDEAWERQYFPFVFDRWSLRPIGFWGQGLSEQLTGLQLEINKILRTIQISMHLVSVPKLLIEASSKIVTAHLNNKIGGIIKYAGQPPAYAQLGTIPPELFAHLDRLYERAYEIAGISQLSANAQKPAGLDSGKALREFNDLESERFMSVAQRYEATFMQAARIMVDLAKEIDADLRSDESNEKAKDGYIVKVKGKKFLDTIRWQDVDMDEDKYLMQMFPTSALASTPSGRLQDVQELLQAGFVSKEDGMKLLDFPDLQQFYNFNNAGVEDIERAIELIIEDSNYQTPEPYQNLQLGIQKFQQAYLYYRANSAPEEKLELLRRWIEDAGVLLRKASTATTAPGGAGAPSPAAAMPPDASMPMPVDPMAAMDPMAAAAPAAFVPPVAPPPPIGAAVMPPMDQTQVPIV